MGEIITLTKQDDTIAITIAQPVTIVLPSSLGALLVVLLRCIKDTKGKPILTFQKISDILGHPGRQWSQNIMKAWENANQNLPLFLQDKRQISEELLKQVSDFVLLYPLRSILDLHREFIKAFPEQQMCINAFRDILSAVDCCKFITSIHQQLTDGKLTIKSKYFISVLLNQERVVNKDYKAYISELVAAPLTATNLEDKDIDWSNFKVQNALLISLLYTFGVSQQHLSLLFGVSKTTIHNIITDFCDARLTGFIFRMIGQWSGKVNIDEKWIKIKGSWQYILSAVDSVTGMPLLVQRFASIDTADWTLFMSDFKSHYGVPTLITSDGSGSLLAALRIVFPRVRHQLCWFHKLKNLYKHLYKEKYDPEIRKQVFTLVAGMFHRKSVSSRKKAARDLYQIAGSTIQCYMKKSIFGPWLKLTLCLTNNAAERFNRKIEKCFACRYGVKNEACADVLIRCLWFSEILLKGKVHWKKDSGLENVDLPKIVKNSLDATQIIHFLQKTNVQTFANAA